MKSFWYTRLLGTINIGGTGIVAENLQTVLGNALFQNLPQGRDLDQSLSNDVSCWFRDKFNPWFRDLSTTLEVGNTEEELTDPYFLLRLNRLITALSVSRAYYAKVEEDEYMTSLRNVALYQASICEEISNSLIYAFEEALKPFGEIVEGKTTQTTEASSYEGTTPNKFVWNGNVLVNHVKYENVKIMENSTQNPQNNQVCCSGNNQYLPWVFCAAFGLIAWSAAAKESNSKQQRSKTNK